MSKELGRPSLETEHIFLSGLDKAINVGTRGVFVGGLAMSVHGFIRRNPDVVARGIGIAAAGLILQNIDNPAQRSVGYKMRQVEDALDIV